MKCQNCGADNLDANRFCERCGIALGELKVEPRAQNPLESHSTSRPMTLFSDATKRKMVVGTIIIAIILIVATPLGYMYYNQPVRGSGSVSASTVDAGQEVAFGFTPNKGISPFRYSWAFGDGATSSDRNPHHTYSIPGTFAPAVTVRDEAGRMMTWTTSIQVNHLPQVVGTISPSAFLHSSNASFTAQAEEGTPGYSYSWQFGDGASRSEQNPTHYYTTGNYVAVVVVTDDMGMTASWSTVILVPHLIVTGIVTPTVGASSLNASFSAQAEGGTRGYSYLWEFGDGTTSALENTTHHYSVGIYTATVIATDALGITATWSTKVSVNSNLTVGWLVRWVTGGESFTCTPSQGAPPYSFYWDIGLGQSSTQQNFTFDYGGSGTTTITLTVTDSIGNTAQLQKVIQYG